MTHGLAYLVFEVLCYLFGRWLADPELSERVLFVHGFVDDSTTLLTVSKVLIKPSYAVLKIEALSFSLYEEWQTLVGFIRHVDIFNTDTSIFLLLYQANLLV